MTGIFLLCCSQDTVFCVMFQFVMNLKKLPDQQFPLEGVISLVMFV